MSLLLKTLERNDSIENEEGVKVMYGPSIKWIDHRKFQFVRDLLTGEAPVIEVESPDKVVVTVNGQPATMDTPIGAATHSVEARKHLGRKG